jgi:hypothetical protein
MTYQGQESIGSVRIRLREALFPDRQLRVVGDEVVRAFSIEPVGIGRHDDEIRTLAPLGQ